MSELHISLSEPERPPVDIDGTEYHIKAMQDLTFKEQAYLNYVGNKVNKVLNAEKWDDEQADELPPILDTATKMVFYDLPEEVRQKLSDTHRMRVIAFFSEHAQLPETDEQSGNEQ
jgi:hypothetical protein